MRPQITTSSRYGYHHLRYPLSVAFDYRVGRFRHSNLIWGPAAGAREADSCSNLNRLNSRLWFLYSEQYIVIARNQMLRCISVRWDSGVIMCQERNMREMKIWGWVLVPRTICPYVSGYVEDRGIQTRGGISHPGMCVEY